MQVATWMGAVAALGAVGEGCLDRPLVTGSPTTKTNFTTAQQQNNLSKVDLLFDIDNSASMGDKQAYLEQAVPDLINRLVSPNCITTVPSTTPGAPPTVTNYGPSVGGTTPCAMGVPEFPAVHDMHIGIVSSSLGDRGVAEGGDTAGAVCVPATTGAAFKDGTAAIATHNDDMGHLLGRTATGASPQIYETEGTSADVGMENFLDWFPMPQPSYQNIVDGGLVQATPTNGISGGINVLMPAATPLGSAMTLEGDFAALVAGTHSYGCGIESQLESWYRFLVQPDPYAQITVVNGHATWGDSVDTTIIQQRHDFLRPDSLVAIIVLSDENDSEIDVRSFGGQAWQFMNTQFAPERGTQACLTTPGSAACQSCFLTANANDPNCKLGPYTAENDPGNYINVRHVHMQQRYGLVPQYPLERYVLGMNSNTVPDRNHEYPAGAQYYQGGVNGDPGDLNCANPLFAGILPTGTGTPTPEELCNAAQAGTATRTASLVFFAHIGGVPHQLLQLQPGETETDPVTGAVTNSCPMGTAAADCPQKNNLLATDWAKILGNGQGATTGTDPYDYAGIDTHMVEAFSPRNATLTPALPTGATPLNTVAAIPAPVVGAPPGPDPYNGWEWDTAYPDTMPTLPGHSLPVDREYACIFPLTTPRDCSGGTADPLNSYACDCGALGLPPSAVPSVCNLRDPAMPYAAGAPAGPIGLTAPTSIGNDYTTQYFAKTYPTIRQLTLANLMGPQGIISSLCPIHTTDMGTSTNPDELYGYRPAVAAIINRLKNALASQCLPQPLQVTNGEVPCLILATLKQPASQEATACAAAGLTSLNSSPALQQVLTNFNAQQHADYMATGTGVDLSTEATCEVPQLPANVPCASNQTPGWCYVTGSNAGACATQAINFTSVVPNGATLNLQCILENGNDAGGGG
jgi:hypothetical protein